MILLGMFIYVYGIVTTLQQREEKRLTNSYHQMILTLSTFCTSRRIVMPIVLSGLSESHIANCLLSCDGIIQSKLSSSIVVSADMSLLLS